MRPTLARTVAALVLAAASLVVTTAPSSAATASAGGYDNPSCRPSAAHPNPVVLLHGLGGNGPGNLGLLGLHLAAQGFCAFDTTYGETVPGVPVGGLVDIHRSAAEIRDFIEQVRGWTGAAKVDIVGHSEGGFHSLYVPKALGVAGEVGRVVALAPPTHGTSFGGLVTVADTLQIRTLVNQLLARFGCPACKQILAGGEGNVELNTGPITQPGIAYTVIASRADVLVTPHDSAVLGTKETGFIHEPGVRNEYVQDTCPLDPVGHIGLAYDSGVAQMITNALDPAHAAKVTCSVGAPF
ncbi:lipase family alpha/beta hydrolase [Kutzneria albida]|uniref:Lipase class 2 n=1 Tax=Kutzneria albida DSM 43870 TaxID=1449976 RepID=W5W0K1_9PSEU|nr:lipase [Kutzneria albida]AHH94688.1 lipase class 2 [Kutzneria albida DSM 43870]